MDNRSPNSAPTTLPQSLTVAETSPALKGLYAILIFDTVTAFFTMLNLTGDAVIDKV